MFLNILGSFESSRTFRSQDSFLSNSRSVFSRGEKRILFCPELSTPGENKGEDKKKSRESSCKKEDSVKGGREKIPLHFFSVGLDEGSFFFE